MQESYTIDILKPQQIDELLQLQHDNLRTNITKETALENGFLTFRYSKVLINLMLSHMAQPIISYNSKLIAYALATAKQVCESDDQLKPILSVCENILYKGKLIIEYRYYVLGQICVADKHRGKGLFKKLYTEHKKLFAPAYDLIITEISVHNIRSMEAHKAIGFEVIDQYTQGNTVWNVVLWDLKKVNE